MVGRPLFTVWYVIVGILGLALCLPMVPRRFLAGAPEFLLDFGLVGTPGNNKKNTKGDDKKAQ